MKLKLVKLNANEKVFFVVYAICLTVYIFSASFYGAIIPGILFEIVPPFCVFILTIMQLVQRKITHKALVGSIFIGISVLIIANVSNNTRQASVFYMLFFLFAARKISFDKVAQISAQIIGIVLLFIIFSAWAGIITNYVDTELREGVTRYYLGFTYTLYAPALLLNYTMLKCFVQNEKFSIKKMVFLLVVNYMMFYYTRARLSFVLAVVTILISFLFYRETEEKNAKKKRKYLFLIPTYIVCAAASIGLSVTYINGIGWMRELNSFLGARLSNMQRSLLLYGVSLFGKNVKWVGAGLDVFGNRNLQDYLYVDCLYVQILQHYGIIFTLFLLGICTFALYKCYKTNNYKLMVFLALVAVHALIDDLVLYMEYNTFWFAMMAVIAMPTSRKSAVVKLNGKAR